MFVAVNERKNLPSVKLARPDVIVAPAALDGELLATALAGEQLTGDRVLEPLLDYTGSPRQDSSRAARRRAARSAARPGPIGRLRAGQSGASESAKERRRRETVQRSPSYRPYSGPDLAVPRTRRSRFEGARRPV